MTDNLDLKFFGFNQNSKGNRRRIRIWKRDNGICQLCKLPITNFGQMTIDHIIPVEKGGTYEDKNIRAAHAKCNHIRGGNRSVEHPPEYYQNRIGKKTSERNKNRETKKSLQSDVDYAKLLYEKIKKDGIENISYREFFGYFRKFADGKIKAAFEYAKIRKGVS